MKMLYKSLIVLIPLLFLQKLGKAQSAEEYLQQGQNKIEEKKYLSAIRDLDQAILLDSNLTEAYYSRAVAEMYENLTGNAITDYSKAIELNIDNIDQVYFERAYARSLERDLEGTLADYTYLIENASGEYAERSYMMRANIYGNIGEFELAETDYTSILENYPEDYSLLFQRGYARLQAKKYELALEDFNTITNNQADIPEVYIEKGNAYLGLNQLDKACEQWQTAADLGMVEVQTIILLYCQTENNPEDE